jgi:hypothetical protein
MLATSMVEAWAVTQSTPQMMEDQVPAPWLSSTRTRNPPALQHERHRRDRFFERLQRGLGLALQLDQDKGNDFVA